MSSSKGWSVVWITIDEVLVTVGHHLLLQVKRQQEGLATSIIDIVTTNSIPRVLGEPADSFPELGPGYHQGVSCVVALLVKFSNLEVVL